MIKGVLITLGVLGVLWLCGWRVHPEAKNKGGKGIVEQDPKLNILSKNNASFLFDK